MKHSVNLPPFCFSGHTFHSKFVACLSATFTKIYGGQATLNSLSFVLLDFCLTFLIRLEDQRRLSFYDCLRIEDEFYVKSFLEKHPQSDANISFQTVIQTIYIIFGSFSHV